MNFLKKTTAVICAAVVIIPAAAAHASTEIMVMAHSLRGSVSEIVAFYDHEPIQVNNTTLAPVRDLADAAGMSVEWDQSTQTATMILDADEASYEPAKIYAARVMEKAEGYGLELTPQNITADLTLDENTAVLKYNFSDTDGDIVSIGKTVEMDSPATLVDGGSLMVPVRDAMELFGLEVMWNQATQAVNISIPEYINVPSGMQIMAGNKSNAQASVIEVYDAESEQETAQTEDHHHGTYIGRFKITHYCPCSICNGGYGAHTAWAGGINPGTTIAVNPDIIPPLSWVYVDGYGLRRAEDTGSGIGLYHIDMAVPTHAMAMQLGVVYKDVYRAE